MCGFNESRHQVYQSDPPKPARRRAKAKVTSRKAKRTTKAVN